MHLKAVIFDFDGTLTKAGSIDFISIRKKINCPENQNILEYINNLDLKLQKKALNDLNSLEYKAAEKSIEEDFADDIINFLKENNIPVFIVSRNSRKCLERSLENFKNIKIADFEEIISRDNIYPVKPDPASIFYIANRLNISSEQIVIIGDYIHDIIAGKNAGSVTIYKETGRINDEDIYSDYRIKKLNELPLILSAFIH